MRLQYTTQLSCFPNPWTCNSIVPQTMWPSHNGISHWPILTQNSLWTYKEPKCYSLIINSSHMLHKIFKELLWTLLHYSLRCINSSLCLSSLWSFVPGCLFVNVRCEITFLCLFVREGTQGISVQSIHRVLTSKCFQKQNKNCLNHFEGTCTCNLKQ